MVSCRVHVPRAACKGSSASSAVPLLSSQAILVTYHELGRLAQGPWLLWLESTGPVIMPRHLGTRWEKGQRKHGQAKHSGVRVKARSLS